MVSKSRLVVSIGLVIALAVAATAFADGTADNTPQVIGSIKPTKLSPKTYKPVALELGVATDGPVNGSQGCNSQTGGQCNPEAELIELSSNIKWVSDAAEFCTVSLNGTTTDQAKALCPASSNIGAGLATIKFPPGPNGQSTVITDDTVTVFNGPAEDQVRLHAYSPTLTATNTQVIFGEIVKAVSGKKYGAALKVADAPDAGGDAAMITSFGATIAKASKVALARCKKESVLFKRTVTYDDGSTEPVTLKQKCQQKGN